MKCILHIGTEKTATTLLQEWLYLNREALSERGVALSDALDTPNNRRLQVFFKRGPDDYLTDIGIRDEESKRDYIARFMSSFREEVRAAGESHSSMVITSEHFHSRLLDAEEILALRNFLVEIFDSVTVLCYFREQSDLAVSSYSTGVRFGHEGSIEDFLARIDPDNPYYNYLSMMDKWKEAFGAENLVTALYDRGAFVDGDIRADFMARVLPEIDISSFDYSLASANERLSLSQAILLRAVNKAFPRYKADGSLDKSRMPYAARILKAGSAGVGKISCSGKSRVYEAFTDSNRAFSKEYLDRDDTVFTPPREDGEDGTDTIEETNELIEALVSGFADLLKEACKARLCDGDADVLRDVALKCESGKSPSRAEALLLMELARSARPSGGVIRDKLREWSDAAVAKPLQG